MNTLDFGFGALEAEFWRWVFLMTRIGAALFAAPFFGAANVSAQVRVTVAGAIALLVLNWVHPPMPPVALSLPCMIAVTGEILIGVALGFVLQFAFAAPTIAAEVIGGGMGLNMASTIDPQNGAHSPAIGQYFGVMLTLIFLALGGHLQWIALVVKSYTVFPPGHVLGDPGMGPAQFWAIAGFGTHLLATAVAMALPVTLVLFLVQTMFGVLSRTAPSLNLFSFGMPAGIIGGFAALTVASPMITDRMVVLTSEAIEAAASLLQPPPPAAPPVARPAAR
jgi:flagellar biosynthesis protein FliR